MNAKEYNKQYYADHKDDIKRKMFAKEQCLFCDRQVNHQNMARHKLSKLCINNRTAPTADPTFIAMLKAMGAEMETIKEMHNKWALNVNVEATQ
jgi:hypothetical protein